MTTPAAQDLPFQSGVAVGSAASTREAKLVVIKHHWLVRLAHWLTLPLLLGLILSGLSIYWSAPVFKHHANPVTGNEDYFADFGAWVCRHVWFLHHYQTPTDWFYDHFALGTGQLANALRLHWLFAYPFMLLGVVYLIGAFRSGSWRALLPRPGMIGETLQMARYYAGLPFAKILRREWKHPEITAKYNALQRGAYGSVVLAGILVSLTGWAIHKPTQLWWLTALFGGYQWARIWHFALLWFFVLFTIPHVILVFADGWDTLRSMVVGWSERTGTVHAPGEVKASNGK